MIIVTLGDILLNGSEVPERINGGGQQMTSVHQLIGGLRIVDTLGRNDDPIVFKGIFRGVLSLERVAYLENLRVQGNQVSLNYSRYSYNVIVSDFKWRMEMAYQVYYTITLTVVSDLTCPVTVAIPTSFSDAILGAFQEALDIATFINDGGILGAMGLLGAALTAVPDLNSPTLTQIANLTTLIANTQAQVNSVIGFL